MTAPIQWICAKCGTVMGDEQSERAVRELRAEVERLRAELAVTLEERNQFLELAAMRDNRDIDMQEIMRVSNALLLALRAIDEYPITDCNDNLDAANMWAIAHDVIYNLPTKKGIS